MTWLEPRMLEALSNIVDIFTGSDRWNRHCTIKCTAWQMQNMKVAMIYQRNAIFWTIHCCTIETRKHVITLLSRSCLHNVFRNAANAAGLFKAFTASGIHLIGLDLSSGEVNEDLLQRRLTHWIVFYTQSLLVVFQLLEYQRPRQLTFSNVVLQTNRNAQCIQVSDRCINRHYQLYLN